MTNAGRIATWRRAIFCEKSDKRLPVGLRLFQHWQVCRIIHPLDTNDSWYVPGQPIGDRRTEVSVMLTPQDENGPVEPLHRVQRAHRFQIVLTIKLPMKKSAQPRIAPEVLSCGAVNAVSIVSVRWSGVYTADE